MKLIHEKSGARAPKAALVAVFPHEGEDVVLPEKLEVAPFAFEGFRGEFREVRVADAVSGPARRVAAIGLGKRDAFDAEKLRRAAAIAVQRAEQLGADSAALVVDERVAGSIGPERAGQAAAEGALLGSYRHDENKSKPKQPKLRSVAIRGDGLARGVERGRVLAGANAFVRDLQNRPGNQMTPRALAAAAKKLAVPGRITCRVFDEQGIAKLGMGLLLGVAQGSRQPPRLVHLAYKPKGRAKGRVALVGKGLTFDAGGISIKPSAKMDEMRFDMSGGAAVLGVFHALRTVDVPFEVHGVVPCSENLPGGAATKPGDIHVAMNGTTVEVLNTDAEGRLILADALCYVVEKVEPDVVVDLATLTGAVVTALGHELAGMFASTARLRDELQAAGEETGERLWPLPLLDHHREAMKGQFADLKNIAPGDMGAGSSAGAAFLAPFVGDLEWAHLDIAGTAWGGSNRDWVGGPLGSGFGTRLLVRWLETRDGALAGRRARR